MPTNKKINDVEKMAEWMSQYEMLVSTDYTSMSANDMNQMRKAFRQNSVQYTIIKNTLARLAAEKSGKPKIQEIVEGPTGIAYGSGDPVSIAKTVTEFISTSRLPLKIRGGIMDDTLLTIDELEKLATLPSKDQLIANFARQIQSPVSRLVQVLNNPIVGLVTGQLRLRSASRSALELERIAVLSHKRFSHLVDSGA